MRSMTTPVFRAANFWLAGLRVCVLVACLPTAGCLDAEALIAARQAIAIRARLEEVDLGEFRISLPQPAQTTKVAKITFHAFGQVANRDVNKVKETLELHGPELRHRLLLASRQLSIKDIEDPALTALRANIVEVVNSTVPGEPLQSVGFYRFSFSNL